MPLPIYVSRNGVLISPAQAAVSVFNPALYGAFGVYESLQVVNGRAFEQTAHLSRLAHSAEIIGLPLPADLSTVHRWIAQVLAANEAGDCTLRLFVVGADQASEITAYLWPQPPTRYPAHYYTQGASTITFEAQRFLPEAKSLNTLASHLAQRAARAAGVHEGLLHHDGFLTEGASSNLFAVVGDEVLTPSARQVLSGVTRDLVIDLARREGIAVRELALPLTDRPQWTECFITSTSRHVMPVTIIDGKPVGDGQVGPLTARLHALFERYFAVHTHPHSPMGENSSAG